jgi:outer membrane lipoprotein-sorting protein
MRLMPSVPGLLGATLACVAAVAAAAADAPDRAATELVRSAFNHYRGEASHGILRMTIHRPEWERSQTMEAWSRGEKDSVIVITEPARDRGNGSLKRGDQMWTFNPRVNRVIKLPPSLMSQSWMGSDFTNHDLARSDSILVDYDHSIEGVEQVDGHAVTRVRLTPKPGAPVVWGFEELLIRDDSIVLEERYYDQDGVRVKTLVSSEIAMLGGRLLPRVITMVQAASPDNWTRVEYVSLEFRDAIAERYFTEAFLRNPRE